MIRDQKTPLSGQGCCFSHLNLLILTIHVFSLTSLPEHLHYSPATTNNKDPAAQITPWLYTCAISFLQITSSSTTNAPLWVFKQASWGHHLPHKCFIYSEVVRCGERRKGEGIVGSFDSQISGGRGGQKVGSLKKYLSVVNRAKLICARLKKIVRGNREGNPHWGSATEWCLRPDLHFKKELL